MSANWNYMVEFLSGKTERLTKTEANITDIHCMYVESLLLDKLAITRNKPHKAVAIPLSPRPPVDLSA